jgi:hypothetical protein
VHGETSETPITSPKFARSRCQPIAAPGRYQAVGRETGERGGALADGKKKRRHWLGLRQATAVEIVAEAERHDAPLAEEAVKRELFERQVGEGGNEARFLASIDQVRRIAEAGRHRLRLKECELLVFHGEAGWCRTQIVVPRRSCKGVKRSPDERSEIRERSASVNVGPGFRCASSGLQQRSGRRLRK